MGQMDIGKAFAILGIPQTRDIKKIRKAYADRVKSCHPEDNPAGWQQLWDARQAALGYAKSAVSGAPHKPSPENESRASSHKAPLPEHPAEEGSAVGGSAASGTSSEPSPENESRASLHKAPSPEHPAEEGSAVGGSAASGTSSEPSPENESRASSHKAFSQGHPAGHGNASQRDSRENEGEGTPTPFGSTQTPSRASKIPPGAECANPERRNVPESSEFTEKDFEAAIRQGEEIERREEEARQAEEVRQAEEARREEEARKAEEEVARLRARFQEAQRAERAERCKKIVNLFSLLILMLAIIFLLWFGKG